MITDFGIGELRLVREPTFWVMNDDDDEESEAGL